jgi:hypothetical protein
LQVVAVAVAALLDMPMVVLVVAAKELAAPARCQLRPEQLTMVAAAVAVQTLDHLLIKDGLVVLVWLLFLIHLPLMTLHQLVAV